MRLKISHLTEYRYDEPAQFSLQRLRLTPPTNSTQKVLGWALKVEGATPEVEYDDQYGNHVNLVSLEGEQEMTRILAEGEVETGTTTASPARIPASARFGSSCATRR